MDNITLVAMNLEIVKVTLFALLAIVPLTLAGVAFVRTVKMEALRPLRRTDRRARSRPSLDWEIAAALAQRTREPSVA